MYSFYAFYNGIYILTCLYDNVFAVVMLLKSF